MTWQYTRMSTLLRIAPWVDLAQIREALVEDCTKHAETWPDDDPAGIKYKSGLDKYKTGDRCAIPDCYDFKRLFRRIMRHDFAKYRNDYLFGDASNEIARYFFYSTFWVEK